MNPVPGDPAAPHFPATVSMPVIGFQPYDEAVKDFLTVVEYPDPNDLSIKRKIVPVMGPPRREYATREALDLNYKEPPFSEKNPQRSSNQIVVLPAMALSRLNWRYDLRRWTRSHLRKLGWTEDGNRVLQANYPTPVDVSYQLDLWAKYRTSMNQLEHHIIVKFFAREVWLSVNVGGPWGTVRIPLILERGGPQELTDIDPGENDRTVRCAFSFTLQAWIFSNPVSIPTVRKIVVTDQEGNVLAQSFETLKTVLAQVPKKIEVPIFGPPGLGGPAPVILRKDNVILENPSGAIDGSNVIFLLSHMPVTGTLMLFYNGILQSPATDFTVSGPTITTLFTPEAEDTLWAWYIY